MNNPEQIRAKFRQIGCVDGALQPNTIQCDFYAEFMRRSGLGQHYREIEESYAKEWAQRFATGSQFQASDQDNQELLLDIMVEGTGEGNRPHIDKEVIKKWCKKWIK